VALNAVSSKNKGKTIEGKASYNGVSDKGKGGESTPTKKRTGLPDLGPREKRGRALTISCVGRTELQMKASRGKGEKENDSLLYNRRRR